MESLHRKRLAVRFAVAAVWAYGVWLAIQSGFDPGFLSLSRAWPYPLRHVLIAIAQITLVSLCLYDSLRPQPDGSSVGRMVRATTVSFVMLVWMTVNTFTDQPGYASVAGLYVFIVTALLVCGVVLHGVVATIRSFHQ